MTNKQTLKLVFHTDTIAFLIALVMLWLSISLLVESNYDKKKLATHTGQLVGIDSVITEVKNKMLFKEVTKELRLTIDAESMYFKSITTEDFGEIVSQIEVGDTVTIFTKSRLWGIFGMKTSNDISHLSKGRKVIIDFEEYKQTLSGLYIMTLVPTLGFFIFYYVRTRRRYFLDIASEF